MSSSLRPPRGGANRRCDRDGYRPDTLGGDVDFTIPPMPVLSDSKLGYGPTNFLTEATHLPHRSKPPYLP